MRLVFLSNEIRATPKNPATVAPAKMAHESLDWLQRNPTATPGSTAWESVSPKRESLRVTIRLPHYATTQTHEDRTQENHSYGFVRQGEKPIASSKNGVPLGTYLLALEG